MGFCSDTCTTASDCGGSVPVAGDGDGGISYVSPACGQVTLDQCFINQILTTYGDAGAALVDEYLGGTMPPLLCTTPTTGSTSAPMSCSP